MRKHSCAIVYKNLISEKQICNLLEGDTFIIGEVKPEVVLAEDENE